MDRVTKIAAAVMKELENQKKVPGNGPKGLPRTDENTDVTDSDYPTAHQEPPDMGFTGSTIIAGTGNGPAFNGATDGDQTTGTA
jgi:hypothetical protein